MSGGPIVAGWDGSERGRDALALAATLARTTGSRVIVAHAYYSPPEAYPLPADYANRLHAAADAMVEGIPRPALTGVSWEARGLPGQSPPRALHDLAEQAHAELVVLGSTHHGPIGRVVPGSVADRFLHGAPCPVAIAPRGYASTAPEPIESVAVGFDGSPGSDEVVKKAGELAQKAGGRLRIVAVDEPLGYAAFGEAAMILEDLTHSERDWLESAIARVRAGLPAGLPVDVHLREGSPSRELIADTEDGADLLVLGSRGYGPVGRVLLGGTASRVAARAACPVLVLPR